MQGMQQTAQPTRIGWPEVEAAVAADDAGKWDAFVPRDVLRFENGRLVLPRTLAEGRPHALRPSGWATGQLCQRLGVPAGYFRKCPAPLQDAQANHWLHHAAPDKEGGGDSAAETRWLLRAKGGDLRGVLSERYARLGNAEVLSALQPLALAARFEVRWLAVTDESFHLRLTDPRLRRDVTPGDTVMAGLHVSNSEVGARAVTVDALVFRLVCTNGLVRLVKGRSVFHRRHLSVSAAELSAALSGAVREALMQGTGFIERLAEAARTPLPEPDGAIATIASDWSLSRAQEDGVTGALRTESRGHTPTLYHLVNAVTQTAQALAPDERYALEVLAGRLLEAGPPVVKPRATAALVALPEGAAGTPGTLSMEALFGATSTAGGNGIFPFPAGAGQETRS